MHPASASQAAAQALWLIGAKGVPFFMPDGPVDVPTTAGFQPGSLMSVTCGSGKRQKHMNWTLGLVLSVTTTGSPADHELVAEGQAELLSG